jgi:hypothetical protein
VRTLSHSFAFSVMTSRDRLSWGSLPLEHYVLAHWTSLAIDFDKRRRQLAQQYTAIGCAGRFVRASYKCDPTEVFS